MAVRVAAAAGWGALVVAWVGFAPPVREGLGAWILEAATGVAPDDPWVLVHFNLMGLWPLVFVGLLDGWMGGGDRPRWPAWPFVLGVGVLGAWALLPWFILGGLDAAPGTPGPLTRALGGRWVGGALTLASGALWTWGLVAGDPGAWNAVRANDGFVWLMTWDFLALWATSAAVVALRGHGPTRWLGLLPLTGAALWIAAGGPRHAAAA